MLKKFLVLALFSSILNTNLAAEESVKKSTQKWYQIEYALFEHLNSDRHVLRYEDVQYALPKREQYYYLSTSPNPLSPFQLKMLKKDDSDFSDVIKRISNSSELRLYSSGSWQQAIQRNQKLAPLKIAAGRSYDEGSRFQLEGELLIRRGRYMHIDINVFFADFTALPYKDLKDWFFENEDSRWPLKWLLMPLAYQHPSLLKVGESLIPNNLIHFKQSRRIKDTEVHYLDHPALGLMVTIKEIDPPFEYGEYALGLGN